MRNFALLAVGTAFVLAGCGEPTQVEPLATDGPNQVVLRVPGMT